jgi:hypothetical protein
MRKSHAIEAPAVKHLFLDLEDTVITPVVDDWANTELINCEKVKSFIEQFQPNYVNIFSFAVWHAQDLAEFNWSVRPRLEKALEVPLTSVPLLDTDILQACCNAKWISSKRVHRKDVINFWGKQEAFRLFTMNKYGRIDSTQISHEVVLLDDQVHHEEFLLPKLGLRGRLLNIGEIP